MSAALTLVYHQTTGTLSRVIGALIDVQPKAVPTHDNDVLVRRVQFRIGSLHSRRGGTVRRQKRTSGFLTLRYFFFGFFAGFDAAFFEFSSTLNLTILLINLSGNGLSSGNCTEPLAPL